MGKCSGSVSCQSFRVLGFIIKMTIKAVGTRESHPNLAQALPSSNMKEAVKSPWDREGRKCPPGAESPVLPLLPWGKGLTDAVRMLQLCEMQSCEKQFSGWKLPSWVMALQKAELTGREESPEVNLVQKWDSDSRAADLGCRVSLPCLILEWWSSCFYCTHPLSWCFLFCGFEACGSYLHEAHVHGCGVRNCFHL